MCFTLTYYPKPVSKEIANTFNWKTTHYSWLKQLLNPLPSPFHLYGDHFLPPQLTAIALFQHINPCNFSRSLEISLKCSVNITDPPRSWIMCKNIQQPTVLKKFWFITLPLTLNEFRRFCYNIYSSWISWISHDKAWYCFCLFCKMVIKKTIVIGISLSTRNSPYKFNAPIVFWLKLQVKSML